MGVNTLKKQNQKGFTLIELLVVIAIIGLLASVVLLALGSARSKSRDAKRVADVRQVVSALELYYNDNNGYPTTMGGLVPTYLGAVPAYPTPIDGSSCSQTNYTYATAGTAVSGQWSSYALTFCVGATTGGLTGNTVHTASPTGIQ
jgi:prepilin-type N-terminal cleavage/methylation domain-containing protein